MSTLQGKDGVVQVSDIPITQLKSWSLDTSASSTEIKTMGSEFSSNLPGIKTQSGSIELLYDKTDSNGQELMEAGEVVSIKLFLEADESGGIYFGGNALITDVSVPVSAEDMVTKTISFVNADTSGITKQTVG